MKKTILIFILASLSISTLIAQHDIRINVGGALAKNYGFTYEYIISDLFAAGLAFNSSFGGTIVEQKYSISKNVEISEYSFMPEVKQYAKYRNGGDGLFVGAYLIYTKADLKGLNVYDNITRKEVPYDMTINSMGVGILEGIKYITDYDVFIEATGGIGYMIIKKPKYSEDNIKGLISNDKENNHVPNWDFRIQLNIGYRF